MFTDTSKQSDTVLVTGASGYIANHVVAQLFQQGYNIIGTVRSESKGQYLAKRYPGFKYSIVDLSSRSAFDNLFQLHSEIKYVIHMASPIDFKGSDENLIERYVTPSIDGVKNLLYAAYTYGINVKKIVYTSSVAAAYNGTYFGGTQVELNETTWNNTTTADIKNEGDAYVVSKAAAERYFWEFSKTKTPQFAQATILFPLALGPPIQQGVTYENINASMQLIKEITSFSSDTEEITGGYWGHTDVRDVARTHVLAIQSDKFNGERSFIYCGMYSNQQYLDIIHKFRPEESKSLPVGNPGYFDPRLVNFIADNSKTLERLNFEFIPVTKTIIDVFDVFTKLKKESEK